MSRIPRNYKAEYARRIERGKKLGRSTAEARGHGKTQKSYDPKLEEGLKALRRRKSQHEAARSAHVAPERLRQYLTQTGVAKKERGRWVITEDLRPRPLTIFSQGQQITITVQGYEPAR